jgi:uncharacterized membrane protein YdjX (TVP38/TMEM64 family)
MKRHATKIVLALLLFVLPVVLLRLDAVRAALVSYVGYLRGAGALGFAVFLGVDVVAALLAAPTWLMSGAAGYVWGFWVGLVVALPAVTLMSCLCFLVSRRLFRRELTPERAEASRTDSRARRWLRAIHRAAATEGLRVTFLLRLTFVIPQNLLGYLLGSTPVTLRDYAAGSLAGYVPMTIVHVYIGSVVVDLAAFVAGEGRMSPGLGASALAVAVLLAGGALYSTARVARRALARTLHVAPE